MHHTSVVLPGMPGGQEEEEEEEEDQGSSLSHKPEEVHSKQLVINEVESREER